MSALYTRIKGTFCTHNDPSRIKRGFFIDPLYPDLRRDKCLNCGTEFYSERTSMSEEMKAFGAMLLAALLLGIVVALLSV